MTVPFITCVSAIYQVFIILAFGRFTSRQPHIDAINTAKLTCAMIRTSDTNGDGNGKADSRHDRKQRRSRATGARAPDLQPGHGGLTQGTRASVVYVNNSIVGLRSKRQAEYP